MGATPNPSFGSLVVKSLDFLLLTFFLFFTVGIPIIDTQTVFPPEWFQSVPVLVQLKAWFVKEFGYYLVVDKPYFYVGSAWLVVGVFWPLSVACVHAMVRRKSWFRIACLIAGVNSGTTSVAVLGDAIGTGKGTTRMYVMMSPFYLFSAIAIIRGLISSPPFAAAASSNHVVKKKKAN